MAKAKQLPSGSWRCRATLTDSDGNKITKSFTAETARKAETMARMWQEGFIDRENEKVAHGITLGEAIDNYIETCRCAGMSPSTIRGYVSCRKNAYTMIDKKPIRRLTVQDIQRQINARSKSCSPKTLRNEVNVLSAALKSNGVKLDFDALRLPKIVRKEMEIPTDTQIAHLLDTLRQEDDDMFIAVMLAAIMGLRRSEICALTWGDIVSIDGRSYLDITKASVLDEDMCLVAKTTKTNAGTRKLPLPDSVRTELLSRRSLRKAIVSIGPNVITERYERITSRLGIPGRFHDLRHYHASVMIREGVPEKYIVSDMGHASFDMVRRVYGHVMGEKQQEINAMMGLHADNILSIATKVDTKIKKSM